jgi:hypothetical protein
LLKPPQELVGRQLRNPPLAGITSFEVLANRRGRDVVELAQAIGLQDRVGRVDGGGSTHHAISSSGSNSDARSPLLEKGRNNAEPAVKMRKKCGPALAWKP